MLDRLDWEPLKTEEAIRLATRGMNDSEAARWTKMLVKGLVATLPFYKGFRLLWLKLNPPALPHIDLFILDAKDRRLILDGTSKPIHDANETEGLALRPEHAADYLRFFCYFVCGEEGPFPIIESLPDVKGLDDAERRQRVEMEPKVHPIAELPPASSGALRFRCTLMFGANLFEATFAVSPDGQVLMEDDEPLLADIAEKLRPSLPTPYVESVKLLFGSPAKRARVLSPAGRPGDSILENLVEQLLEEALGAQSGHRLIARFNMTVQNQTPLRQFADLLTNTTPVIAIESGIPFVEEVIARIVLRETKGRLQPIVISGSSDGADDTRLRISVPGSGPAILLFSMHAYRGVADVLRVAHELGSRGVAALIGCERLSDVPTNLREIVDITLQLPPMAPARFEALFTRVMGAPLPTDWQQPDAFWAGNVLHTDLEHPLMFQLSPPEALAYVRDRVRERLRTFDAADGLGLANLHGLGEARQFAEDLIAGIHAAIANKISWSDVDRGVLLAGPPGTGKTTLARAIAKDCGIKFINASAAGWQAAGHLGDHIRAIRADFAQARRFAPSILFIDEIDSVGNRELLSGPNMQYQAEVVNAVLEQMQGLDPRAPVIVIGATNSPDRVDPALRRAGRLDRTIEIPYPNSVALTAIFDHYLKPLRTAGELAADVDTRVLGQMCLRHTGADVENFVRGAKRRARKAGHPVTQADLLAEITGRPRDPNSMPRMSPEEIERVALHESGHAIARFLGATRGTDIAFVSIVPRADGSLGFVAYAPPEKQFVTRAEYIEHLEIALAGRAAEEMRYGIDGVSGGASDDLMQASRMAQYIITKLGLGPDRKLLWSETASPAHLEQAEKLLADAYAAVKTKLEERRAEMLALTTELVKRQELTGPEVLAVLTR